ncbi:hypothetical protein [Rhodococcus sp. NPDC058521]|uniref:hypothetical protein n=1 Tax=Rhodococcus sp. NPDC058521 TaxID=3346536 RepID=UPI0036694E67
MIVKTMLRRAGFTIGICGAGAIVAAGTAHAETTFDNPPPTAHLCPAGLADSTVVAQTSGDENDVQPGQVSFEIDEGTGTGANVAWINTNTMRLGSMAMTPGDDGEPEALATTGPGPVMAAVYGIYTNDVGENCLLVPGVNTDIPVPGEVTP